MEVMEGVPPELPEPEVGPEDVEEGKEQPELEDENAVAGPLPNQSDLVNSECLDDPNFAIICSFFDKFGQTLRLGEIAYDDLQTMLENSSQVPEPLVKLHIMLLRRVYKTIAIDKWERALAKFGHSYCNQDGWEIERFGYKKSKLQTKLRILKNLLEAQFDYNVKFKSEVNKLEAGDLRLVPLGRDCEGQLYWYQVDQDANLRVYREDVDDETWEIVAYTREGLCDLITKLQHGDIKKPDQEGIIVDEDSNSKEIETKEILLDTGKVELEEEDSSESETEVTPVKVDNILEQSLPVSMPPEKPENKPSELPSDIKLPLADRISPPPPEEKMEVDDQDSHSDEMQIDESSPNSPPKIDVEVSDKFLRQGNVNRQASSNGLGLSVKSKPSKSEKEEIVEEVQVKVEASVVNVANSSTSDTKPIVHQDPILDTKLRSESESKSNDVKIPVVDKPIIKTETWVCGSPETGIETAAKIVTEKPLDTYAEQDNDIKMGSDFTKQARIEVEETCTQSKTWICGENDNSLPPPPLPIVEMGESTLEIVKSIPEEVSVASLDPQVQSSDEQHPATDATVEKKKAIDEVVTIKSTPSEIQDNHELVTKPEELPKTDTESKLDGAISVNVEESVTKSDNDHATLSSSPSTVAVQESQLIQAESLPLEPMIESEGLDSASLGLDAASEIHTHSEPVVEKESEVLPLEGESHNNVHNIQSTHITSDPPKNLGEPPASESKEVSNVSMPTVEVVEPEAIPAPSLDPVPEPEPTSKPDLTATPVAIESKKSEAEPVSVEPINLPIVDFKQEKFKISEQKPLPPVPQVELAALDTSKQKLTQDDQPKEQDLNPVVSGSTTEQSSLPVTNNGAQVATAVEENTLPTSTPEADPVQSEKPNAPGLSGLVSYGSSSEDEDDEKEAKSTSTLKESDHDQTPKRKASEEESTPLKIQKLDKLESSFNPIVGETVEEEVMQIIGEGSGALLEGGNDSVVLENNQKENLNSSGGHETPSANDDSQDSVTVPARRKRGRPSGKKKSAATPPTPKPKPPKSKSPSTGAPRGRKRKEVDKLVVPLDTLEINGTGDTGNERPVRASRRIAQIREKEEEERRKLEEERLAQLKAAQIRKQQKKAEAEKLRIASGGEIKPKKPKKAKDNSAPVDYQPSPSVSDSSEEEEDDGDEFAVEKKKKRGRPRTNGKLKVGKPGRPWATDSEDDDEEVMEEEEEYHYEEEEHLVFNEGSDHEFSPESDLEEGDESRPSRHARTAKRGEVEEDVYGCKKCGKGDHPEWILLCDKCDHGWHASCLRPQLWVIPEGEWFCPPCQHNMLVTKLGENLVEYDKLLKKRENEILRKKRLAFVGISLDNVLPDQVKSEETEVKEHHHQKEKKRRYSHRERERKSRRRRILSDEEISENEDFIDDDDDSDISKTTKSEDSEDEPIYRLRARRTAKTFDYKEYDDMINSACRASDDELVEPELGEEVLEYDEELNGDEEEEIEVPEEPERGGKNEAYEKHLESLEKEKLKKEEGQDAEDEETDEETLDEKERNRRRELKKGSGSKKKKRSYRDLDDFTDDDNSDEDFKGSEAEDEDEADEDAVEEDESEWSGDKDESDDSLAARARNKGKQGKYGRKDEYLEVGSVRRSTRRRKARVSYDESDQEDDDDGEEKWHSNESEEEETPSESDDETYGKKKKVKKAPARSAMPRFFLGTVAPKSSKKGSSKKRKKKVDEEDVDRAWSSSQGSKAKRSVAADEKVERRTRGRKINFKDILDSGESDDDGNILPKRRRISSDEDGDEAESSRRLAEEIKAANQREEARYAAQQKQAQQGSGQPLSESGSPPHPTLIPEDPNINLKEQLLRPGKETPPILQPAAGTKPLSKPLDLDHPVPEGSIKAEKSSVSNLGLEMALAKPVPAPPIPPALSKSLGRKSKKSALTPGTGEESLKSHLKSSSSPVPVTTSMSMSMPVPVTIGTGNPMASMARISSGPLSGMPILSPSVTGSLMDSSASIPVPVSHILSPQVTTSSKKSSSSSSSQSLKSQSPLTTPTSLSSSMRPMPSAMQQVHGAMPQGMSQGIPMDISRVPNPTLFQGNPSMRPFNPMWVRNPGPPPYGNNGSPPTSIGKPPPLNSSPFMSQHGPPRPGYPSPPPLRIPSPPNALQAFQHFRMEAARAGMYRFPPGQQPLPGMLAGGLVPHQGPPERNMRKIDGMMFAGPGPAYPPYSIMPPHSQAQPQPFSPFDFRHSADAFNPKPEQRGTPPVPSGSPPTLPPHPMAHLPPTGQREEGHHHSESEFGGLVSYFSSQRSEEDMDT